MRRAIRPGALLLAVLACGGESPVPVEADPARAEAGTPRSVERIRHYPALVSRVLLRMADLPVPVSVEHGVTLYRVEYWTAGAGGERTHASGVVALPRTGRARGVVSYQHPTRTSRENVPSTPSRATLLAAIAFAGHGYILVAPDYLGLGTGPGAHPYLHAATEASAVVDLLRAARDVVEHHGHDWPDALFLTGFSQGGHASLAAQRALEAAPVDGLRVAATAPIAGVYDLSGVQFPHALEGGAESHPAYLGYLTSAYARVYGQPLRSVIVDRWATAFDSLYDGSREMATVAAALPRDPRELFRPEFLHAYAAGEESWLTRALADNDVVHWTPQAPLRFYYGTRDRDSPAADTRLAVRRLRARGSDASAVDVGGADHGEVVLRAVPRARAWFDSLSPPPSQ